MKTPEEIKRDIIACLVLSRMSREQHEAMRSALLYIGQLEAERDAAVADIKEAHDTSFPCVTCKHYEINTSCDEPYGVECPTCQHEKCPCAGCGAYSECWAWRGVQKEERE